jgi:hypothetical protein
MSRSSTQTTTDTAAAPELGAFPGISRPFGVQVTISRPLGIDLSGVDEASARAGDLTLSFDEVTEVAVDIQKPGHLVLDIQKPGHVTFAGAGVSRPGNSEITRPGHVILDIQKPGHVGLGVTGANVLTVAISRPLHVSVDIDPDAANG